MAARYWEQLAIPEGFPTGSLFGRAGRNIREVRAHTGVSRIDIDTVALTIDIGGATAAAVAAAAAVYRRVFANAAVIANFNRVSPGEATVLLGPALEAGACFVPVPHGDEAAAATDKRSQLYALAPAPPAARLARLAAAQRPAALDATAQLPPFVFESGEDVVAACLAHAMHAALGVVPPYQAIKLRSTLGKQLFGCGGARGGIRSPAVLGALSMADLQELSLGYQKYLQGVFSTGVPAAKVSAMLAHLRELVFERAATKRTVTVHLYERLGFVSHAIAFRRIEGGGLKPTEVRHGKTKLFFAAHAAGDSRPDFRLKLTGTRQHGAGGEQAYSEQQQAVGRELMKAAAGCRLQGCNIVLPPAHQGTFYVDRVRFIDKEVYRGTLQVDGTAVEVSVKVQGVRDEEGRHRMEVGATCPRFTEELRRRLAARARMAGTAGAEAEGGQAAAAGSGESTQASSSGGGSPLDVQLYICALLKISRQLLAAC